MIAIENVRLFEAEQQRTRELTKSLEQQTATSELLSVISRSKFELQPILQSVVDTAARLCRAEQSISTGWRAESLGSRPPRPANLSLRLIWKSNNGRQFRRGRERSSAVPP